LLFFGINELTIASNNVNKIISDYELWALLDATSFAISRLRQLELAQFGLTIEQAVLLRLIQTTENGATIRWIKDTTLRQQNTISINVNRMATMGLVAKERSPGEREFRIVCTQKGRYLLESAPTSSLDTVFAVLTPKEKQPFCHTLCTLLEKARSMLVFDMPPFMRYTEKDTSSHMTEWEGDESDRFSSYRLWMYLNTVSFTVSRLRKLELARFGLTVEQATVLNVLVNIGIPVKARDLENATLRQHHSISTLVNRMMNMNLVAKERKPGENSYRISITDSGKRLYSGVTTAAISMTFCVLSEREKQQLAACLHSLYAKARYLLGVPSMLSSPVNHSYMFIRNS
jgi:DNA-binding MarR family transcriptional regulator